MEGPSKTDRADNENGHAGHDGEPSVRRILIADDDLTSRVMLKAMLSKWEFEVIDVNDGEQALSILSGNNSPDIAVLDWLMPGMHGPDVVRRIRLSEKPAVKAKYLILLTSMDAKKDITSGLESGADDYIVKPFDAEELKARVNVGLRIVALEDALTRRAVELEEALAHVKTLQGILPICMHCHRIRTDDESWEKLEKYICEHSDAQFSHGLCPTCLAKYYPEEAEEIAKEKDRK
ncbi:MAG: response regulator transcription factor [Deltaproteobacteria bacterium]|nr:response regulator transcription factor [Deltaproteobacteria bacterium]